MTWLETLRTRGRGLFRREAVIDEIQQEMRSHVELATEANIASGMDPVAARDAAKRGFGNLTRMSELAYDVRAGGGLETMWQDLRFGIRTLFRNPGFAAVAILTLALGTGATSAIFSFVYAVVLRPLPYHDPHRLVSVVEYRRFEMGLTVPDYLDWRAAATSFEQLAAAATTTVNLTGRGEPERVAAARVSGNYFDTLGIPPAHGRGFRWSDEPYEAARVVVLGDGLWRRRFAADPGLVGQTIAINGEPHVVIGIMPPQLSLRSTAAQLWLPLNLTPQELGSPGARFLTTTGRLRRGVTATQAQAELAEIARRTEKVRPQSNTNVTARVRGLHEAVVSQVRDGAFILLAAVSFVLLIACANVANLLLARATRRQAEMSVRAALGAARSRIARQLLTESAAIGLSGAVAGLVLAYAMTEVLKNVLPADIPRLQQTRVDVVVLGFTLAVSLVASLLFGVAPALRASRPELQQALRDESRSSGGLRRRRLSRMIVATEIALALVLLVAAGLLLRSFVRLQRVDLGFDPAHLLTVRMSLPEARYGQAAQVAAFYQELATNLGQQPGVKAAAVASTVPLTGSGISISMTIEGRPGPARVEDTPNVFLRFVSADYFRTLAVRIQRGRDFSGADRANTQAVAIVNETTAKQYWPDQDPLGRRFRLDDDRIGDVEIVGVVADVRNFSLAEPPAREVFMPLPQVTALNWQWLQRTMIAIARTTGEPESVAGAIRHAVRTLDAQLPLYNLRSMEQLRAESTGDERAGLALVGTFAAVALVLASIGVYGVMAFMVAGRSREIGVRLALGATPRDVRWMILRDGGALTAVGVVIGLIAAFAVTRMMATLLFETQPTDPVTFLAVGVVIAAAAMLACWVPARRSTRVDPVTALRAE
ncbi:MAG TPA: ABC transporter permease [Vicinamibacterales bacterium]|nr:ABC transporter permease [Vicinamibacterales bacterium]